MAIPIHLRIFPRRFIGGFLDVESELLDQLVKPDGILSGGILLGWAGCKPVVRPLAGRPIRDGRNVARNLGRLFVHRRRTEHRGQATIEPITHPQVERKACQQTGRRGKGRPKRSTRG
jgi:hypothetical protein